MDSMPKQAEEPKAPDKNSIIRQNEKDFSNRFKAVGDNDCDKTRLSSGQDSTVSSLDETGLKALLDEAIAYRTPNDVQGKSDLFKELLHCAETENKFSGMERPERHNRKLRRRQGFGSKKDCDKTNTHGSLQDLAQVHNLVPNQDEFCKSHAKNNSKQRLTSWKSGGQDINMIPYKDKEEDYSSVINNGNYGSFTNFYKLQQFISNETNIYKVVDDQTGASPYTCPEKKTCDENSQTAGEDGVKAIIKTVTDEKEKSLLIAEALNREGLIEKKNLDENGNALGNNLEFKRKRRGVKAKNDKNTILSQHIEGHRSDIAQDIDALMKYIESPTHGEDKRGRQMNFAKNSGQIVSKLQPRDKSSETLRKGRKSKDTQFHKSNSLEEVSVSKFEDLTQSEVKKSETQHDIKSLPLKLENKTECQKVEQRSCPAKLEDSLEKANKINPKPDSNVIMIEDIISRKEDPELQDAEFHTVTKKQKKRKNIFYVNRNRGREQHHYGHKQEYRHDYKNFYAHDNKQRGGLYSFKRKNDYHRRKSTSSVPSSEKSGESSDLDSVHSLPVSSTKVKRNEINSETRANSNHTSYADIIKAVPAPVKQANESPCILESCDKTSGSIDAIETSETIPSVMVPLPKKREKNSFSPICSPQDYPPLLHIGDSNQVNSCSQNRSNTNNNQSISSSLISPDAPNTANDSENKTSNSSNDMFVEFTLVVPSKDKYVNKCVNVEETVYLKIKPSDIVTHAPPPGEEIVSKRPPVILLTQNKERPIVNDLEFGFEINEQLLQGEEELAIKKKPTVENSHLNDCKDNYYANVMKATSNGDINSIIKFISSDWEYIQSGLAGEVQYFSG